MPGADSCAVMEGENEGDLEDEVVYTKPSLLGKLKAIASKVGVVSVCSCLSVSPRIGLGDIFITVRDCDQVWIDFDHYLESVLLIYAPESCETSDWLPGLGRRAQANLLME